MLYPGPRADAHLVQGRSHTAWKLTGLEQGQGAGEYKKPEVPGHTSRVRGATWSCQASARLQLFLKHVPTKAVHSGWTNDPVVKSTTDCSPRSPGWFPTPTGRPKSSTTAILGDLVSSSGLQGHIIYRQNTHTYKMNIKKTISRGGRLIHKYQGSLQLLCYVRV